MLLFTLSIGTVSAQEVPDILYYRFDKSSNKVINYATNKPTGTDTATLMGTLTIGDTGLCGKALVGSGISASTDYLNTNWTTKLTGSWTIAFWCKKFSSSSTLFYIFGDPSANSFRCFTNGVAGANNWILRGPITDVSVNGGATYAPNHIAFVYNDTTKVIYAYLNGVLVNSVNQTNTPVINGTGPFKVMGYGTNIGAPLGGLIDNFMVFSKALSTKQVGDLTSGKTLTKTDITACNSFLSASKKYNYTKSGTYLDTIVGYLGCDSIIQYNLTLLQSSSNSINVTECNQFISPSKKYTWLKSGNYNDTLVNAQGCDSIVSINLTINNPTFSKIDTSICYKYLSPTLKYYDSSGTYIDTLKNYLGCDSFIYTNLTIHQTTEKQLTVKACGSYLSPRNNEITTSGDYVEIIENSHGCDSIIYINLTILPVSFSKTTIARCNSYVSATGKTYTVSGIYFDTLINSFGCDSIIETDLTIDTINLSIDYADYVLTANQANASYQWLDCNNNFSMINNETNQVYTPSVNGSYAVEVTKNSCRDTSDCIVIEGMNARSFNKQTLNIHPNPSTGIYKLTSVTNNIGKVTITDLQGQTIASFEVQSKNYDIDLTNSAAGIYLLNIEQPNNRLTIKLIKQ